MKLYITIILIIIFESGYTQCPNSLCVNSIEIEANNDFYFCNIDCEFDFYINDDFNLPSMNNEVGLFDFECHQINYDLWFDFVYPEDGNGSLCLSVWGGDCVNPDTPNEGWVMILWQGETCADAEIVWSTNCYWFTNDDPGVITSDNWDEPVTFDPTNQQIYYTFNNAQPGQHYYVQIDSFGWCQGCAYFRWCDEFGFLDLEKPDATDLEIVKLPTIKPPYKVTDLTGRIVDVTLYTPLIFYYRNGNTRLVYIIE